MIDVIGIIMARSKAQSATEFLIQYSWAVIILVVALAAVVLVATTQRQISPTPSYCYISPELNCYQTIIGVNNSGSRITTFFTNTQTGSVVLTGYTVSPSSTTSYYPGNCNVTTLAPGQSAQCSSYIQGFVPSAGSQLNPVFYIRYNLCNGPCSNPSTQTAVSTAGTAVISTPAIHPFTVSTTSTLISSSTTLVSSSTLSSSTFSSSTLSSSTLSSSSFSSTLLSSSTLSSSSSTLSSTTTIQYYTLTVQDNPDSAGGGYGAFACVAGSEPGGGSFGQTCTGYNSGTASVSVPSGSVLTWACATSGGAYTFSSWSGPINTGTLCPGGAFDYVINGPTTVTANYAYGGTTSSTTATTTTTTGTTTTSTSSTTSTTTSIPNEYSSTSSTSTTTTSTSTSTSTSTTSTTIQYYTVAVQINPASPVDNDWGACIAGSAFSQICAGSGSDYASVSVPAGSTISYICTADWNGGTYSFSDWSGGYSDTNPCPGGGISAITVNSDITITANYACNSGSSTYYFFGGQYGMSSCYGGYANSDGDSLDVSGISSITVQASAGSGADQNGYTRGGASTDVEINGNDYGSSCTNNYEGNGGSSNCQSTVTAESFYQSGGQWYAGTVYSQVYGDSYGNQGSSYGNIDIGSTTGSFTVEASANPGDTGGSCSSSAGISGAYTYSNECT